ncbi:hypothetical protein GQX74_012422 [Glossina fuscipes]|nr:hypothetical protein GQX74_012422 [Glossina fuscipes]
MLIRSILTVTLLTFVYNFIKGSFATEFNSQFSLLFYQLAKSVVDLSSLFNSGAVDISSFYNSAVPMLAFIHSLIITVLLLGSIPILLLYLIVPSDLLSFVNSAVTLPTLIYSFTVFHTESSYCPVMTTNYPNS